MHGNFRQRLKNNYSVSSEGKGIFVPPKWHHWHASACVPSLHTRALTVWCSRVWPRTLVCLAPPSTEFSSNNTGGGCQLLLHGIFLPPGSNPHRPCLPHWQLDSLPVSHLGSPTCQYYRALWGQKGMSLNSLNCAFYDTQEKLCGLSLSLSFFIGKVRIVFSNSCY